MRRSDLRTRSSSLPAPNKPSASDATSLRAGFAARSNGGAEQRSFVEARMRGGHVHGRAVARCVHVRNVRVGVGVVAKYAARSIRIGFDGLLSRWTTAKLPRTPRRHWRYCARYAEGWGSRALVRARAHKVEEVERTFTRG